MPFTRILVLLGRRGRRGAGEGGRREKGRGGDVQSVGGLGGSDCDIAVFPQSRSALLQNSVLLDRDHRGFFVDDLVGMHRCFRDLLGKVLFSLLKNGYDTFAVDDGLNFYTLISTARRAKERKGKVPFTTFVCKFSWIIGCRSTTPA